MHVRFSYQSELSRLPGTSRNKAHPKPWPESPAVNSPVSLGRVADGPPVMAGRSARHGRTVRQLLTKTNRASARVLAFQDLKGGQSAHPTRTVRDLVREHVFHPIRSATDRRTVRHSVRRSDRTVRFPNPDGPQLPVQHPFTHSCTTHLCTLCPVSIP